MDLMSQAMETLRLRAVQYRRQAVSLLSEARLASGPGLHFVVSGRARLKRPGAAFELGAGDLLLSPRPEPRTLSARGRGASSELGLVSAEFEFTAPDHPLLLALPASIHVPRERLATNPRWNAHLESLLAELDSPSEGSGTLLARLTEVSIVYVMRLSPPPPQTECPNSGALRGFHDPRLRPVFGAMHEAPGRAWTLAELADLAGQSRSAFAAHFTTVMGEPPMAYLARWRMFRARSLLRDTELPLTTIAEQVGYGSAAAFSLAFSRDHGTTPGAYRARALQERSPATVAYRNPRLARHPEDSDPAAAPGSARGKMIAGR